MLHSRGDIESSGATPPSGRDAVPASPASRAGLRASWAARLAARQGALTEHTAATARAVLTGARSGPVAHLAFVGPAVIASIAYMDPGNFATNIQAGAKYGYTLLWWWSPT